MTRYNELQNAIREHKVIEMWLNSKIVDKFEYIEDNEWKDTRGNIYDIIAFQ
jgi:hypothetical protein